jgi:uncharacterized membrane protein
MSLASLVHRVVSRRLLLASTLIAAVLEAIPGMPSVLVVLAGLWLLFGAPAMVWYPVASRAVSTRDGRVLVAIGLAVLTGIVMALAVNTVLPIVGAAHPLTRLPLAIGSTLAVLVIVAASPLANPVIAASTEGRALPGLGTVLVAGTVAVTMSVAGPIRLNNGFGGTAAVLALIAIAGLLALLFFRRRRYPPAVLEIGLFFAAAGLLLLTSLRGWYITGHDIQREYEVFVLTADAGRWNAAAFRDAYNACLSITVLPTSVSRLTGIPGTYVFKAVFPLLFALTPALVYRSVRNAAPQSIALLSAVYFMLFPTFFTDMTFMARQEIAFLLLGCGMVVLTDAARPIRNRRIMVTALLVGVALSHYSTMYVVLAILVLALGVDLGWRLWSRRRRGAHAPVMSPGFATWWMVLAAGVAAVAWAGPITHTDDQLRSTIAKTASGLLVGPPASGSSDTGYSLLGGARVSPGQRLDEYRADTLRQSRTGDSAQTYLPMAEVDKYPVPAVDEPTVTPFTTLGAVLHNAGLNVTAAYGFVRQAAAQVLQLLLLLGLVTALHVRSTRFRPRRDQVTLTVGAICVIGGFTVLPQLSVDYGVLRAFQQGLFFFAPFIAAGSVWAFRWAGRKTAMLAGGLALLLFLDLTGVVPELLGGSPPQLHLSNAGRYYDVYYVHPEERAAIAWIQRVLPDSRRETVQSEILTDRYTFSRIQTLVRGRGLNDIYPTLVGTRTYVFLGSDTVRKDEATIFYRGDLITYRYPIGLLDATKNKVYCSDGAEIYR